MRHNVLQQLARRCVLGVKLFDTLPSRADRSNGRLARCTRLIRIQCIDRGALVRMVLELLLRESSIDLLFFSCQRYLLTRQVPRARGWSIRIKGELEAARETQCNVRLASPAPLVALRDSHRNRSTVVESQRGAYDSSRSVVVAWRRGPEYSNQSHGHRHGAVVR